MGITGLLPLLKSIHKPCHLKKFSGQTLGVDAYGWLHRGTASCAVDLALGRPTTRHIDFALSRVRMLVHFGIKPYLVFDGDYLPSKGSTESERAAKRADARRNGLELMKAGKPSQAHLEFQKAVDVTPEMARQLIEELKKSNIQYIVAPYEADVQMAFLEKQGLISGIVSEDSDLLVFGARVLITKLDQYGECVMIRRDDFTACREISMIGWTDADFRLMTILSGCDYLANIPSMGLKTAHRLVRKHKTVDRIVKAVQFDGKMKVPKSYLEDFEKAEHTFLYQWVFCPAARRMVNYTEIPATLKDRDMEYIGAFVDDEVAVAVARGDLHPHTKLTIMLPLSAGRPTKRNSFPITAKENVTRTPDVKKPATTIESFFKARRTPLAELDPNCLTPSPTQRRLLEQAERSPSWSAVLAPSTTLRHSSATPRQRSSYSSPLSAPARGALPSVPTPLESLQARAQKRARLCTDQGVDQIPELIDSYTPKTVTQSPFFSRPKTAAGNARRKDPTDFTIFSDDSIEEALANLPDPIVPTPPVRSTDLKDVHSSTVNDDDIDPHTAMVKLRETNATRSTGDEEIHPKVPTTIQSLETFLFGGGKQYPHSARRHEMHINKGPPVPGQLPQGSDRRSLDAAAVARKEEPSPVGGSEDVLVPDTEDEDAVGSDADDQREILEEASCVSFAGKSFDIGKFAFRV